MEGIEFRSVTVVAFKAMQRPCRVRNQAVIYRGPFKQIEDDDGHVFTRGQRTAVCDKTFQLLQHKPYADAFFPVSPISEIPVEEAKPFDFQRNALRDPRESKGPKYNASTTSEGACNDESCC